MISWRGERGEERGEMRGGGEKKKRRKVKTSQKSNFFRITSLQCHQERKSFQTERERRKKGRKEEIRRGRKEKEKGQGRS